MRIIKFLAIVILIWFPASFGLGIAADAAGVPDTDTWMWIMRATAAAMAACISWMVVGAARATVISQAVLPIIGAITNLIYLVCLIMGVAAVVMIFAKDSNWLYQHLYHRFVSPSIAMCSFSLVPIALLLMMFQKTRVLGGISLYLLSLFFGFSLWFYSLMVAGSHGPGWVIVGLFMMGLGVIFTAIVASAWGGQWAIAGSILLVAGLVWGARMLGLIVAAKQSEKDGYAEGIAESSTSVEPMPPR